MNGMRRRYSETPEKWLWETLDENEKAAAIYTAEQLLKEGLDSAPDAG